MDRDYYIIILALVLMTIVATLIINKITENICYTDTEHFVEDYYNWNWNDPNNITLINSIVTNKKNNTQSYSMMCDLSDDSMFFCDKGHNIPIYNAYENNNKFSYMSF
jgi:hypothetical protein